MVRMFLIFASCFLVAGCATTSVSLEYDLRSDKTKMVVSFGR